MQRKPRPDSHFQADPTPPTALPFLQEASRQPLRLGLYHRASTLDQDPALARDELANWAGRQGATIVELIEESASGAWNERPGLQKLLKLARRGQLDAVAVWKLDRFGRSALDVLGNVRHLTTSGVRFVAITQGIDIGTRGDAMSTLMLTVLSAVAEFERSLIVERTRLGMRRAKARGVHCGRPRLAHPSPEQVAALRARDKSWADVAGQLGCSIGVARLRFAEYQRMSGDQL